MPDAAVRGLLVLVCSFTGIEVPSAHPSHSHSQERSSHKTEDAGLSARIPPPRRFGWGDSNRRDLRLGVAYIIQ